MLASLDEFKAHLNLSGSSNDDELWLTLDAASDVVKGIVGNIEASTITESVRVVGGAALLSHRPTGDVLVNGAPIGGVVDRTAGVVSDLGFTYSGLYPYRLTVTYSTGTDFIPSAIRLATLIVGKHLWDTQRPASASRTAGADAPSGGMEYGFSPGIPDRAKVLLEPFARGPRVA